MKKYLVCLLLVMVLVLGLCTTAYAEEYAGSNTWKVEYDGKALNANFTSGTIQDAINEMQPGDTVTLEVILKNASSEETDWYMSNKTLESFEDSSKAAGGAYTYVLTYAGSSGVTELYNSDTVGGDDTTAGVGLHEATNALEDEMFYLDTLKQGVSAKVILKVTLDGETQRNNYQSTQAQLQLDFGVEPKETKKVVKTGDTFNFVPYVVVIGVAGMAILGLATWRVFRLRKVQGGR